MKTKYRRIVKYPDLKEMKGIIFDELDKPSHFLREWFFSGFLFLFLTIFAIPCWIVGLFSEKEIHYERISQNQRKAK